MDISSAESFFLHCSIVLILKRSVEKGKLSRNLRLFDILGKVLVGDHFRILLLYRLLTMPPIISSWPWVVTFKIRMPLKSSKIWTNWSNMSACRYWLSDSWFIFHVSVFSKRTAVMSMCFVQFLHATCVHWIKSEEHGHRKQMISFPILVRRTDFERVIYFTSCVQTLRTTFKQYSSSYTSTQCTFTKQFA